MRAGLAYFALVFGAGVVLGTVRVAALVPRIGVRLAELAEMPAMLVVIVLAARFVVRRLSVPASVRARLVMGLGALAWLVAAELALVVLLEGRSVREYVAGRDPVSGTAYVLVLALYSAMPLILVGMRTPPRDAA